MTVLRKNMRDKMINTRSSLYVYLFTALILHQDYLAARITLHWFTDFTITVTSCQQTNAWWEYAHSNIVKVIYGVNFTGCNHWRFLVGKHCPNLTNT